MPQLAVSLVRLRQVPLQSVWPDGHVHVDPLQVRPPGQTVPHAPQLLLSLVRLRHVELAPVPQMVCPPAVQAQLPLLQVWPVPQARHRRSIRPLPPPPPLPRRRRCPRCRRCPRAQRRPWCRLRPRQRVRSFRHAAGPGGAGGPTGYRPARSPRRRWRHRRRYPRRRWCRSPAVFRPAPPVVPAIPPESPPSPETRRVRTPRSSSPAIRRQRAPSSSGQAIGTARTWTPAKGRDGRPTFTLFEAGAFELQGAVVRAPQTHRKLPSLVNGTSSRRSGRRDASRSNRTVSCALPVT